MQDSRRKKSIRNLLFAWINQIIMLIMNIIVRMVFVRVLTTEYLGLSGLFGNIISMLSLAELGVGTAIVYSLYEPLAKHDISKIQSLMQFYKKVYTIIGVFICIAGLVLLPFLQFFIKQMPDISYIYFIYILFVMNASSSYFFSYRSSLISADQKDYIIKLIKLITTLFMYLAQIGILVFTGNYIIFLSVQIGFTLIQSIAYSIVAKKLYPFITEKKTMKLDSNTYGMIIKNTKALIFHKIGDVVVFSTDNMIISKFVGLAGVAVYSNYTLIQQALQAIITQVFNSMTASVGNLGVMETDSRKYDVFKKVFFLNFWLYGFVSNGFLCLAQDFIRLCFGEKYVVSDNILFIIVINFYITGMRRAVLTFKESFGLFWQNRFMPIVEAVINVVVSLSLVNQFGIFGVLLGTLISTIVMPLWVEPMVLFRYGFHLKCSEYIKEYLLYTIISAFVMIICWNLTVIVNKGTIVTYLWKLGICALVPNSLFFVIFKKCEEMKYFLKYLRK